MRLLLIILGLCVSSCAQAQEPQSNLFEGQWVNDRYSAVMFEVTDGLLSDQYQTALNPLSFRSRHKKFTDFSVI